MNSTPAMPSASPEVSIRIASWNIHGAVGGDRACRPERIARIIAAMEADILVLQEVDGRTHLGRRANAFETMAGLLGPGTIIEARLTGKPGREHGNLLWTRLPILRGEAHLLPGGVEQRGWIEAEIATPMGPLLVLGTHLGLLPATRRRQARRILQATAGSMEHPMVLLGDLNEWMPQGPVHRTITARMPHSHRPKTFPTRFPLGRLDRLYASDDVAISGVAPPSDAGSASDHLPLVADLRF